MATLFYENFKDVSKWVAGNGAGSISLSATGDPLNQQGNVGTFNVLNLIPTSFSSVINNPTRSYTITFDYLGLPRSPSVAVNLGCILSISDGSATASSTTVAYAGSIKSSNPPLSYNQQVISSWTNNNGGGSCSIDCGYYFGYASNSLLFLTDDSNWNHYSFTFSATQTNIRIALADYKHANYPEAGLTNDCYFANLLVTDTSGPSAFLASNAPEAFKAINVNALNKVADYVSYQNSDSAVRVFLTARGYNGFAQGDTYVGIKSVLGSPYNDEIYGNNDDNFLDGGAGNDLIQADIGSDILNGGAGDDTFIVTSSITNATIEDFSVVSDKIDLRAYQGIRSISDFLSISIYSGGSTISNLGSNKYLICIGVDLNNAVSDNFNFYLPTSSPTSSTSLTASSSLTGSSTLTISLTPSISFTTSLTSSPSITLSNSPTSSVSHSSTDSISLSPAISESNALTSEMDSYKIGAIGAAIGIAFCATIAVVVYAAVKFCKIKCFCHSGQVHQEPHLDLTHVISDVHIAPSVDELRAPSRAFIIPPPPPEYMLPSAPPADKLPTTFTGENYIIEYLDASSST